MTTVTTVTTVYSNGYSYVYSIEGSSFQQTPLRKAKRFYSSAPPTALFIHSVEELESAGFESPFRMVNRANRNEILIYADGSCIGNGSERARAGCGFVVEPGPASLHKRGEYFRLESKGPTGERHSQTNNRAELRAVIAALQDTSWEEEGWTDLVIATDSGHVFSGITDWIERWQYNGWLKSNRCPVKNRDLWELLLSEVNLLALHGLEVSFWQIPREYNTEADTLAKWGANEPAVRDFQGSD